MIKRYAKLCRNYICAGIVAIALSHVSLSHAAYSQLTPPVGWSRAAATGASEFSMLLAKPVGSTISAGRISALASLSVNGQAVKVPAKLALTSGAARVAAGLVFANPYVRTAAAVATWLGVGKLVWDEVDGVWRENADPQGGMGRMWWTNWNSDLKSSPEAACLSATGPNTSWNYIFIGVVNGPSGPKDCKYRVERKDNPNIWGEDTAALYSKDVQTPEECPDGWRKTPEGCLSPAVEEDRFKDLLTRPISPMPDGVPEVLPGPLPVKAPEIQPLFIPTGNPVPNPSYDPSKPVSPDNQPWNQPGVRVVPAPTPDDPWKIDVQPINRPVDKPDPSPDPKPDPGPGDGDKPSDDKPGLCDMYPDILACAKPDLDTPGGEIPKSQRSVELSDSDLFGGGACPANVYATIGHQYLQVWSWDQSCYYIVKYLKPVILVLGAFTALMIVSGGTKE